VLIRNVCPEKASIGVEAPGDTAISAVVRISSASCGVGNQSAQRRAAGIGHQLTVAIHWYELITERAAALLEGEVCTAIGGKITLRRA